MKHKIAICMIALGMFATGSAMAMKWSCKNCTLNPDGTIHCETCTGTTGEVARN